MQVPLEITFKDIDPSPTIESKVREKAKVLERFFDRVTSCSVVVEAPHRSHQQGKLYNVRININTPGEQLVVTHSGPKNHAHEDINVAIRDSFAAAVRQLEDHARKVRGDVKTHDAPLHGSVLKLFPDDGYGFIKAADGREIYFHENSVVDGSYDQLQVGDEVRLVVVYDESPEGPQASTVKPVGKHHIVER